MSLRRTLLASLSVSALAASSLLGACVGDDPAAQKTDAAPSPSATTTSTAPSDAAPPPNDSAVPDTSVPDTSVPDTSVPDAAGSPAHLVFVTDAKVDGAFAGAGDPWVAADAVCATEARANSLPGTYVAWLSWETATGTKFNAASRIGDFAYALPGGVDGSAPVLVAASKAELLTQGPRVQMDRTGSGAQVDFDENSAVAWVWTGTNGDGSASLSNNCVRWTSATANDFGTTGNARRIPSFLPTDWTSLGGRPCNLKRRFYCFQK